MNSETTNGISPSAAINQTNRVTALVSPKSRLLSLVLAFFVGGWGVHRFYAGKIKTGIGLLMAQITVHVLGMMAMANFAAAAMLVANSDAFTAHIAQLEAQATQTDFNNVSQTLAFARLLLATPVGNLNSYMWMFNLLGVAALAIGVFVLVDFVKIAFGKFADGDAKLIKKW